MMLILDLLGMYFDAAVVFVTKSSLLFRLALAILCGYMKIQTYVFKKKFLILPKKIFGSNM